MMVFFCENAYKNTLKNVTTSIFKSPQKASKINGLTNLKGAYYTTTTPFLKAP